MKRILSATILIGMLACSANALSAAIKGKVTENDGKTPIPNLYVDYYRFDPVDRVFEYVGSTLTDSQGKYSIDTGVGSYYVRFANQITPPSRTLGDPFSQYSSYYYAQEFNDTYYIPETYNNITPLTPLEKAIPTLVNISAASDIISLKLVKLGTARYEGCLLTGPIWIKGPLDADYVEYSYLYYNNGPKIPLAGGDIAIKFDILNLNATNVKLDLEALAFVTRDDEARYNGLKSVDSLVTKAGLTLTPGLNTLKMTGIPIGTKLMKATSEADNTTATWALNLGIQGVSSGLANCFQTFLIPLLHEAEPGLTGRAPVAATTESPPTAENPVIIPLTLSTSGEILATGPRPTAAK